MKRFLVKKDTFKDFIPNELFNAPKHGFSVPVGNWLENDLKQKIMKYSDREFLENQGLFNPAYIHQVIDEHMDHRVDRFSELWAFYVFQKWYNDLIE